MTELSLTHLVGKLKDAQKSLERIQEAYKDEPDLLNFYTPSANFLVKSIKDQINDLLIGEIGEGLSAQGDIDLWIRIDGEEFHEGKGPIGLVGTFLNKLNNANRFAINIIAKARNFKTDLISSDFSNSFDLAATGVGSLKLGLKRPETHFFTEIEQLDLLEKPDPERNWKGLKVSAQQDKIVSDSMTLMLSAIASADDEDIFQELSNSYDSKDLLKVFHLAKELLPSSQSNIDVISFEIEKLDFPKKIINTNKETRKLLTKQAKRLIPDKEFIKGKGMIRGVDLDEKSIVLRPLIFDDKTHDEIRCVFANSISNSDLQSFLDKPIELEGFIIYSRNNKMLRLEIEDFRVEFDELSSSLKISE